MDFVDTFFSPLYYMLRWYFPCLIYSFGLFYLMSIHYEIYYKLELSKQKMFNFVQSVRHGYKTHLEQIIDYPNPFQS